MEKEHFSVGISLLWKMHIVIYLLHLCNYLVAYIGLQAYFFFNDDQWMQ